MRFFDRQGIPKALVRSFDILQNNENLGRANKDDEDNVEDSSSQSIREGQI
jgi:hypothetical protein